MALEPIGFGVFGGRYDGSLVFSLGAVPNFRLNAALAGVDMAAADRVRRKARFDHPAAFREAHLVGRGMDISRS